MTVDDQDPPGWKVAEISYLRPHDVVCALCGQLIPGRYWEERVGGERRSFCDPDHAERYATHWLASKGK